MNRNNVRRNKQLITLAGRVVSGVSWVASGEIARQCTQVLVGIALARLLTPGDFGLVGMAIFVVGLIEALGRCGVTEALIQREELTDDDWSSVYWVGVGLGVLVGLAAWVLASMAGSFYQNSQVIPLVQARGWLALLMSLSATQAAWLSKRMQFRVIAQVEWASLLVTGIVAVAMAWTGWGVWSLIVNQLAGAALTALLFHLTCPWRPSFRVRVSTLRWAVRFGLGLQGFGILNYFSRRLDDALIGRYVGPVGLGYYSRAYDLMLYPVQNIAAVVGRVLFPALSEIGDDLPRFRAAYLRTVSAIATVTFPAMIGLFVTTPEVISVVYGPQWTPSVPILRILCAVGLLQSVTTTVGWIYLVRARTDLLFVWGAIAAVVICSSFVLGLSWGAMGVAAAYAVAMGILLVPCLAIPFRLIHLRITELVRSVQGVFVGALLMGGVVAAVRAIMLARQVSPPLVLAVSVMIGVLTYLAWLWRTDSGAVREARMACFELAELRGRGVFKG